jgi:hypothetical protein
VRAVTIGYPKATWDCSAAKAISKGAFICDMAKAIVAPVLLSNGERTQNFFFRVNDQLQACLPNSEGIVVARIMHTLPSGFLASQSAAISLGRIQREVQ